MALPSVKTFRPSPSRTLPDVLGLSGPTRRQRLAHTPATFGCQWGAVCTASQGFRIATAIGKTTARRMQAILLPQPSSSRQIRASRSCSLHRSSGHWLRPDRATLGNQIIGAVAERSFDHSFPSGKMKKRPARVGADELVPPMLIAGPKRPYRDRDLGSIHEVINGTDSTPSCRKRRSMRAHLKSPSRCRSRCSVSPRLR